MRRRFDVCGLGAGIVDVLVHVSAADFAALDLEKGTMRLVDGPTQEALLKRIPSNDARLVSGGSVANSVVGLVQLGGRGAFLCGLGDDRYGMFFKSEFDGLGIEVRNPLIVGQTTGTSLCLITPDAERTMRTHVGAAGMLSPETISEELIAQSEWLYIEGFTYCNVSAGAELVQHVADIAHRHGTKVALSVSEPFIVEAFREPLDRLIPSLDLVFANEAEACALAQAKEWRGAFDRLKERIPSVVITGGPKGALFAHGGDEGQVDAVPCRPVDLTGAGDMFSGTFMYGITHGLSARDAARAGCYMAMQVVCQVGARLQTGVQEHYQECLRR